jgi:hypothetical protein
MTDLAYLSPRLARSCGETLQHGSLRRMENSPDISFWHPLRLQNFLEGISGSTQVYSFSLIWVNREQIGKRTI